MFLVKIQSNRAIPQRTTGTAPDELLMEKDKNAFRPLVSNKPPESQKLERKAFRSKSETYLFKHCRESNGLYTFASGNKCYQAK